MVTRMMNDNDNDEEKDDDVVDVKKKCTQKSK
jgi:hypothetical protein